MFAGTVRDAGLSVMTFTGHYLHTLIGAQAPPGAEGLLAQTDLLVDGPYLADQVDHSRPWVGSRNQTFHVLTDRHSHLQQDLSTLKDRVEIRVQSDGSVKVNGWATVAALDDLLADTVPAVGRGNVR